MKSDGGINLLISWGYIIIRRITRVVIYVE